MLSSRLKTYVFVALRDVFRLWTATQLQVIIISGICLPILILLGLTNGHVAELRKDLVSTPQGRRLVIATPLGVKAELLNANEIAALQEEIQNLETIIPDRSRILQIRKEGSTEPLTDVTFSSTLPNDPQLVSDGADVLTSEAPGIVLTELAAEKVGLSVGDLVQISIHRGEGSQHESHTLTLPLKATYPGSTTTGFVHLDSLDQLERYLSGLDVPEWNIPASKSQAAIDQYETLLYICYKSDDLTEKDIDFFKERYLTVEKIEDPEIQTLYGTLNDHAPEQLNFYKIQREHIEGDHFAPINDNPRFLANYTEPREECFLYWNSPISLSIDGTPREIVGITLPMEREAPWLYKAFVKQGAEHFQNIEEIFQNPLQAIDLQSAPRQKPIELQVNENVTIRLTDPRLARENPGGNETHSTPDRNPDAPWIDPFDKVISEDAETSLNNKEINPSTDDRSTSSKPKPADDSAVEQPLPTEESEPASETDRFADALNGNSLTDSFGPTLAGLSGNLQVPETDQPKSAPKAEALQQQSTIANGGTKAENAETSAEEKALGTENIESDPRAEDDPATHDSLSTSPQTQNRVVVPHNLLGYLYQYLNQRVGFDEQSQQFTQLPTNLGYTAARLYVRDINDVPAAFERLKPPRYSCECELSLITNIHRQDNSLRILVLVVAFGVFLFGIITVFSVMVDSTDRKKGTIGILRVMGTSQLGVFLIVLLRSVVIGLLAAVVCVFFGWGLANLLAADLSTAEWMSWKPIISVIVGPTEIAYVALGAILCSAFGSFIPALRASRLDPFEAISQGQFN